MAQLKKPTTYQEQLDILRERKVIIDDPDYCAKVLESINYYRFTAYFLPFKKFDGNYCSGLRFKRVHRIYEFDRKLRSILFSALEEVEIYLRAKFAYYHAHQYGPEGYMCISNYSNLHQAEKFHDNLRREIASNGRAAFVMHHNERYGGHFPIWVIVELFSFGMLSRFYSDLKTPDQKQLARELYKSTPKNINSWLRCCTDLRNICAHYGRLYYRKFTAIPANVDADYRQKERLWGAVLALKALYPNPEKWNTEMLLQLNALFDEYREDIVLWHLGFPDDWLQRLKKE